MAKVRVYELAKQLDVQSKDIVSFLAENGIEVKSASGLEPDAQALVEKKFKKGTVTEQAPQTEPEKATKKVVAAKETKEKAAPAKEQRPKKKSSITAVFNAQYSNQARPRREGDRPRRRPDGSRPARPNQERSNNGRPTQGRITVRPESERTVRPSHRVQEERERQERQERRCRWIGSLLRALTPPEKSPAAVSHQSNGPEPDSGTSQCGSEASLLPESRT